MTIVNRSFVKATGIINIAQQQPSNPISRASTCACPAIWRHTHHGNGLWMVFNTPYRHSRGRLEQGYPTPRLYHGSKSHQHTRRHETLRVKPLAHRLMTNLGCVEKRGKVAEAVERGISTHLWSRWPTRRLPRQVGARCQDTCVWVRCCAVRARRGYRALLRPWYWELSRLSRRHEGHDRERYLLMRVMLW